MYAKCGALRKAQEAFDGLSVQNVSSWNALIGGYAQNKHDKEALTCFEWMQNEGVSPDFVTFGCVLKACGSLGAVDRGRYIHALVVKQGLLEQSQLIGNALVDMYVKCGMFGKAQEVFDELPSYDVITWTALIMGHALQGHGEEALWLYGRMQEAGFLPNAVTFLGALKACSTLQTARDGQVVHAEIVNEGLLEKDLVVGNALVDMYSKCDMMAEAKDVFDALSVQDSVLWSTLIDGYAQNMQGHRALQCFEQMQIAGFCPDEITLASVIKACGDLAALDIGERLHNRIAKDKPLEDDPIVSHALVGMYSKCGIYEKAQEVFSKMPDRNVVAWNALISGYVARGKWEEAMKSFERMEKEGLCPDIVTFISVCKACGNAGALNKGQTLHARVLREGLLEEGSFIANALLYMYVKCGLLEKAKDVFHQLRVQDCAAWKSLIAGHIQGIHCDEALNCIHQMQLEFNCADEITFACALKARAGTEAIDKGQEIYNRIMKEDLMEKSLSKSKSIIDMYAKWGLLEKAQEVLEKIAIPDLVSWNNLIAGYSQHGDGEQVLKCFEKMKMAGFSPDPITLVCVLKACGSMGAIQKGEEVHAEIKKAKWLEKDVHVGAALMDMYAKCGLIEKAQGVFDELPCHDVVSWNVLMTKYGHQSLADDVLSSMRSR